MFSSLFRYLNASVVTGAAVAVLQSSAVAGTLTGSLADNYDGGVNYYPGNTPSAIDVIGPAGIFNITGAAASLSTNTDTMTITINTYFAGAPGSTNTAVKNDLAGTTYGSLFLGSASTWNSGHPSTSQPWPNDIFNPTLTPAEWTYAVNSTGVYSVGTVQSATNYPTTNVAQSYTTSTGGQIVMSNVNGDPVSYPNPDNPSFYFRQGQAVQYNPGAAAITMAGIAIDPTTYVTGTDVAISEGSITYTIDQWSQLNLGENFALSWAMTCANDVIQGTLDLTTTGGGNSSTTPIPPALPLFAAGLGVLCFAGLGRRSRPLMRAVAAQSAI